MSPCTIGVVPVIFAAAMMLVLLSSAETFSCSAGRYAVPSNSSVTLVNCAATMAFTATNASNVVFTLSNASVTLDFINVSNITVVWDNSPLTYQDGDVSSWAPSINASLIRCRDCTHVHITMKDITIAAPIATAAISIETSAALDRQRVSYVSVVLDQVSLSMLKYYLVRVPSSFSNLTVSVVDSNIHLGHALEDACSLINNDIAPAGSAVFAPNFTFQRSNLFSACYLKNITGSFVQGIVVLNFARPQAAFISTVVSVVQFVTFVVEQSNIQFQYVPNVDPNVAHSVVWDVRHRSMMITIAGLQAYAANTWLTGNQIFRFVDSTIASSGKVYAVLVTLEGLSMQLASDIAAAAGLAVQAADVSNTPLHLVIENTSFRAHVEGTLMSTAVRSVSGLRLDGSFTLYNAYISITNSTFDLSIQGGNNESVAEIVTSTTMAFIDVNSANTSTFIFEDTVFRGALTYGTMTPFPGEGYKYVVVIMAGLVASSSLSSTYNGCIVSVKRTQWVGGGNFGPSTGAFAFFFVTLTGPVVAAANMTDCVISVVDSQVFSSGVTVTKSPTTAATSGFIMTFVVCTLNTDDVVGSFLTSVRPQTAARKIAFSNASITALRGTLTTTSPQLTALPAPSFHSAVVMGGAYYNCNITAVSIGSPNNGFPVSSVSTPLWAVIIGASANVSNATSITIINCNSSNGGPLAHFSAEVPGLLAVATQHMDRGSSVVVRDGLWVRNVIEGSLRYCIEVRPTVLLRVSASVTYVLERNQFLGAAFQKVFSNRSSWFFDPYDLRATTTRPISIGCNIIQESEVIAVNMGSAPRGLVRVRGLGEPLNSSYTCMEAPYTSTVGYTCSVSGSPRWSVIGSVRNGGIGRLNASLYVSLVVVTEAASVEFASVASTMTAVSVSIVTPSISSPVIGGGAVVVMGTIAVSAFTTTADVTIELSPLGIEPRCDASMTVTLTSVNPSRPIAQTATSGAVVAAGAVAALVSPGTAVLLQRSMAMLALAGCDASITDPPAASDSPLQLQLGNITSGGYVRGAVVGNIVFLACACALGTLIGLFSTRGERHALSATAWFVHGARAVGLPGLALAPLSLLLQPTVTMSVLSLSALGGGGGDVVLGLMGLTVYIVPCVYLGWMTTARLQCEAVNELQTRRNAARPKALRVRHIAELLVAERVKWISHGREARVYQAHFSSVFEGYVGGRTWFVWIEMGTGLAYGVLTGFEPSTDAGCRAQLWVNFVLSVAILASAALWPYNGLLWNLNYALNGAAMMAVAVLMVLEDDDASGVVAMVAAWVAIGFTFCDLFLTLRYLGGVNALFARWFGSTQQLTGGMLSTTAGPIILHMNDDDATTPKRKHATRRVLAEETRINVRNAAIPADTNEWIRRTTPATRLKTLVILACRATVQKPPMNHAVKSVRRR